MSRTATVCAAAVVAALGVVSAGPAADLSPALKAEIEKAVAAYQDGTRKADKALLDAIEKEIEATRKLPLKADQRQAVIQELTAEKDSFERDGTIPFSPRMRKATTDYLKRVQAAARPADLVYDRAIDFFIKAKEDTAAAGVAAEKKKALEGKIVANWACRYANKSDWNLYLRADGTSGHRTTFVTGTWAFEKDRLVVKVRADLAPPSGTVGVYVVSPDGQGISNADNKGKLVPIAK